MTPRNHALEGPPMAAPEIKINEDVVFGSGGGRDLVADVYTPEGIETPAPAVLMLYGGGWRRGDIKNLRQRALALAGRGFIVVASEYRLSGESRWPAHIHDAKAAIRWLHANAQDLGVDPTRIAAVGFSAGAHLALLAAGTPGRAEFAGEGGNAGASEELAAAAVFYAPVRFQMPGTKVSGGSPIEALAGDDATEAEAIAAAPLEYVTPDFPPTLLLSGTFDKVVPVSASMRMYEALTAAGVTTDLRLYGGLPHGFDRLPGHLEATLGDVALFLDRVMVRPEVYAEAIANPPQRVAAPSPAGD
jgi:acetyl esterase/lipase